jgi:hypothetical protein
MATIEQNDGDEQTALENRQREDYRIESPSTPLEHDSCEPRDQHRGGSGPS